MTRRRTSGPLVARPTKTLAEIQATMPCRGCCNAPRLPGDVYCDACRATINRDSTSAQLSWDALLPATTEHQHVPGQLDLSDALNPKEPDHA